MLLKELAKGLLSFTPGFSRIHRGATGGTDSARYCYSVWLRHLILSCRKGSISTAPEVVAELGPGDSLGTGLAAVLSGANKYFALDVIDYTNLEANNLILNELISLFKQRADIPDEKEFPRISPKLDSYKFPHDILTGNLLERTLSPERLEEIKHILYNHSCSDGIEIKYFAPWHDENIVKYSSIDLILSQAVLEHVSDLSATYGTLYGWLKKGGCMSHQIGFGSHHYFNQWDEHRKYSDFVWKMIQGRRECFLNRQPYSSHINLLAQSGFDVIHTQTEEGSGCIDREKLNSRFKGISGEDMVTRGAYILSQKT